VVVRTLCASLIDDFFEIEAIALVLTFHVLLDDLKERDIFREVKIRAV
jgi:hypothetical protein